MEQGLRRYFSVLLGWTPLPSDQSGPPLPPPPPRSPHRNSSFSSPTLCRYFNTKQKKEITPSCRWSWQWLFSWQRSTSIPRRQLRPRLRLRFLYSSPLQKVIINNHVHAVHYSHTYCTTVTVRYIRNISLIVAVASVVGKVSAIIAVSAKWTLVILPTADVQLTKAYCKCGWGVVDTSSCRQEQWQLNTYSTVKVTLQSISTCELTALYL